MKVATISDTVVDVYTLRSEAVVGRQDLLDRYAALLTAEEQAKQARYAFPEGRLEYLLTRALVRTTLSRYADVAPEDWRFSQGTYGKPAIANPGVQLEFNLSNTAGLIACAVTAKAPLGVDVEDSERRVSVRDLARSHFAASENAALLALPEAQQRFRFFQYWTLKEAYIKARGMGLRLPLDQFAFTIAEPPTIAIDSELGDDASQWLFRLFRPTQTHLLALGARLPAQTEVRLYSVVPFVNDSVVCMPAGDG